MSKNIQNQLLQDPEIFTFLEAAVLQKAERYEELLKMKDKCSDQKLLQILDGNISESCIRIIFARFGVDLELQQIERDLNNICRSLRSLEFMASKKVTYWELAYQYATKDVRIENVVCSFTHQDNFNKKILCPFHPDKKPSLKVYIKNNRFKCFGCGIRGSPIDFVMAFKGFSFKEAVLYLYNF